MKSQHLKFFFLLMAFLGIASACKPDRKWTRLELACNDGWYSGYEFQITSDGHCLWQKVNTSSDFKALLKHGTAPPELMNLLNETLCEEEFLADTSLIGCVDCGNIFLYVKFDNGADTLKYFSYLPTGTSGRMIQNIESFIKATDWQDSPEGEMDLELFEKLR